MSGRRKLPITVTSLKATFSGITYESATIVSDGGRK